MSNHCQDRDLLSIEPGIFINAGFPGQELSSGTDGAISGTTFTSQGSNFTAAKVQAGMVLSTYTTTSAEGKSFEITSIDSGTTLTISVLRTDCDDELIPPPSGSNLRFYVRTFGPQIQSVSTTLSEKLRQMAEVAGISTADFADSAQLRITTAHGVLASIFLACAENAAAFDANWIKAEYYRDQFRKLQIQLRLVVDSDGNGTAEQIRTLGNVTLRRA